MPGTNAGTGHRLTARCFHCARGRQKGCGYALNVTGRRRYRPSYNGASRRTDVFWQYEVRCVDCRRLGWSRHSYIAEKWRRYVIASKGPVETIGGPQ